MHNQRIVHLDLKGAPPRLPYFKEFFKIAAAAYATGILIEWEDMFPFTGLIRVARNHEAYSVADVQQILRWANESGLQVIPLAQTAGHLEWLLKHPNFAELREVPTDQRVICLTDPQGLQLAKAMIDQMLALHGPYTQYFHVGADEVYQIGKCDRCMSIMAEQKVNASELLLNRIQTLSRYIFEKHGKTTLMWHDMLDRIDEDTMNRYDLQRHVEPVVWIYAQSVDSYLNEKFWTKMARHFPSIWGASAFKGANGANEYHTVMGRYILNNAAWAKQARQYGKKFQHFRGIILTGWQRYTHFTGLCELLPSSIPSLVANLLILKSGQNSTEVFNELNTLLKCSPPLNVAARVDRSSNCSFPGDKLYYDIQQLKSVSDDHQKLLDTKTVHHHNYSLSQIGQMRMDVAALNKTVTTLALQLRAHMQEFFFLDAVEEFMIRRVIPLVSLVRRLGIALESIPTRTASLMEPNRDSKTTRNSFEKHSAQVIENMT